MHATDREGSQPEPPVEEPPIGPIATFDALVDRAFDHLRGRPVADRIFYAASELGDFSLVWHTLAVARGLRRGGDIGEVVRLVSLMGAEAAIVNGGIKSLFRRGRPGGDHDRPHRLRQPRTSSFPSGHASAATTFVVVAGTDDPLAPVYVAVAAVVAASRIHVRIHHASDVVGGIVTGAVLGSVLNRWWPAGQRRPGRR